MIGLTTEMSEPIDTPGAGGIWRSGGNNCNIGKAVISVNSATPCLQRLASFLLQGAYYFTVS